MKAHRRYRSLTSSLNLRSKKSNKTQNELWYLFLFGTFNKHKPQVKVGDAESEKEFIVVEIYLDWEFLIFGKTGGLNFVNDKCSVLLGFEKTRTINGVAMPKARVAEYYKRDLL